MRINVYSGKLSSRLELHSWFSGWYCTFCAQRRAIQASINLDECCFDSKSLTPVVHIHGYKYPTLQFPNPSVNHCTPASDSSIGLKRISPTSILLLTGHIFSNFGAIKCCMRTGCSHDPCGCDSCSRLSTATPVTAARHWNSWAVIGSVRADTWLLEFSRLANCKSCCSGLSEIFTCLNLIFGRLVSVGRRTMMSSEQNRTQF